jgi:hypothetical protein
MCLVLSSTPAHKDSYLITNIYNKSLSIKEVTGNNYDLNTVLTIVCLPICRLTKLYKNHRGAAKQSGYFIAFQNVTITVVCEGHK